MDHIRTIIFIRTRVLKGLPTTQRLAMPHHDQAFQGDHLIRRLSTSSKEAWSNEPKVETRPMTQSNPASNNTTLSLSLFAFPPPTPPLLLVVPVAAAMPLSPLPRHTSLHCSQGLSPASSSVHVPYLLLHRHPYLPLVPPVFVADQHHRVPSVPPTPRRG